MTSGRQIDVLSCGARRQYPKTLDHVFGRKSKFKIVVVRRANATRVVHEPD